MKHISLRFQLVLCALILCVASLWAVPAKPGWQTKTQPDGTPVSVQLMGDEFCHYWMTQDGKIAKEQSDGTFIVMNEDIPTGEQVAQRRMASKRYQRRAKMIGAGFMPPRALFILVSFSNQAFKSTSETYYKSKLGETTEGAMSMYNYLKQQSNGKYAPPVDVYGPYTLSNTYATYGANDSNDDDQDPAQMIVDACKAADSEIDFSQYDGNNDGWVDNVYVLYAGKGEADGGAASTIWPHQWNITYGGKSLTVDGKKIGAYACSAELNGSSQCAMGTPLHEFGHVIGLPDYYDTEYKSTNYTESRTPGSWSIMDQGSYNNSGNTPPNYSIFDKYFLGWVTPKFLAKDEAANVTLTTDATDGYQITGGTSRVAATATSPATIYYIENRQKSGWDAYLPGHGMIVWQVKYNSSAWSNNNLNNTGGSPRYTVLSASGTATNIGKATDPFPGTGKVKTCTPVTGCAMTDITESSGIITFKYNGGIDCHNVVVEATGCTIEPSSTCVENSTKLTANITPTDGTYDFTSLTVKRGSTTLTKNTHYTLSSDNKSLTINASAITGSASDAITITAVWTKNRYSYAMLGENCTEELEGAVNKNAGLNLTIAPDAGYTLADAACWDVTMGGNKLTYGTGFTYSGTTFSIATVTGDVEIMAFGLHPVTWSADGSVHATNVAVDDKITLPANPADCASGKKFVGWCTSSNYSHATTAPTFAKEGDDYSVATYYAVYATAGEGGTSSSTKYTFTSKSWADEQNAWKSNKDGGQLTSGQGVQVTTTYSGAGAETKAAISNVSKVIVEYCTNAKQGAGSIAITVGSSSVSYDVSAPSSGGTTLRDMEFEFDNASGIVSIEVTCSTNSIYINSITINSGGGASYSDYSTVCGTPCSSTPNMSFANATVNKTTADASFAQAVTISGKGSGQTVAYSSSNEAVATVNSSGTVTIKGTGTTTITASVDANGTYCSASASYTLNVSAAPINVTLYYNNTSAPINNQTSPYTLPTGSPYNAAMCSGEWTFDGWYGSVYAKSTDKPTYITKLSATGSAYAVYKNTETTEGGGGSSVTKTMSTFTAISGNVDGDENISYEAAQGNAGTAPAVNNSEIRIYQNGGTLTITANNSKKITSVTIGSSMKTTVTYSIDGGSASSNQSISANGTTTVSEINATIVLFTCTGTDKNSRLYLNSLSVTYSGGGGTTSTTYYATSPECATPVEPCELTGITLNTDNVNKSFTTGATFSSKGLEVTANYSNCESATVTPTNVSDPDMSTSGQKTITVTYTENEVTETSTYTITVTDPVTYTVTWSVDGTETPVVFNEGAALVLPTAPSDCSGEGGKTFVGWTASSSVDGSAPADLFTAASGTVTADATYYAVYAAVSSGGGGAFDGETEGTYKIYALVGDTKYYAKGTGSKINSTTTEADATEYSFEAVTGGFAIKTGNTYIKYNSSTNLGTSEEAYTWTFESGTHGTWRVNSQTSNRALAFSTDNSTNKFGGYSTGNITSTSNYYDLEIIGGGGETTYSDYSLTCAAPVVCALTGITLNTTSAKKTFFVGEQFTHDNVVVTANYSNCNSKTVNGGFVFPADMMTKPGDNKTVTVSYTENGVTKEASYEISVVCELESITLNTSGAKTSFIVGEQFTYAGVVVTAHYKSNNCADQTVNGFYKVPDMSSADTKTVNVSYTENGVTKEATYDITVVQPVYYTVTWIACGDTIQTETYREGAHLVFPTSPGANAGKAFYGWTTTQHYTGTSAPPIISEGGEVHANATYYAVYK